MAEDLKDTLKKVLASKGEKKFFFAYGLGKRKDGKGDGELVVRGKKPPPKKAEVEEKLADCKDVFEGYCWVGNGPDNSETVYYQAKGKKLSTAIVAKMALTAKGTAGRQFDFQLPSPEEETRAEKLAEGEGGDEHTVPAPPPMPAPKAPPAPPPAPTSDAATHFGERLKVLAPELAKALASGSPLANDAKLKIGEANVFFRKKDFAQANLLLDQAESLLKQALGSPSKPSAPPPHTDGAALFGEKFKALAPELAKAQATGSPLANDAKLKIGEANVFFRKKDFTQANDLLDEAEALVKQALASGSTPSSAPKNDQKPDKGEFVALQSSRLLWERTRKKVEAELQGLEKAVLEGCKEINANPEEEFEIDLNELPDKSKQLYTILEKLDTRLLDKLDEALNAATRELRQQKQQEAAGIIQEYQNTVNSDALVAQIDKSGFMNTSIKDTFVAALTDLAGKL